MLMAVGHIYTSLALNIFSNNSRIRFITTSGKWNAGAEKAFINNVQFAVDIDTDGDSVPNMIDIDDDNDGILDAVEIQGGGKCAYGFFHMISGQLNMLDPSNGIYLNIGNEHMSINAMGYNENDGKLYAVARATGPDDYGNTVEDNDTLEIDRYSGKIRTIGTLGKTSNSGDVYDKVLYARNGSSGTVLRKWDIESKGLLAPTSGAGTKAVDFAMLEYNGKIMGYGVKGKNPVTLDRINITDDSTDSVAVTITPPPGGFDSAGWGAVFIADANTSNPKLYASNNDGYIYRIDNFRSGTPEAFFVYTSVKTNNNDGASCRNANQYAADSDGDNFPDYLDLDSDNDGIPDNVEAQPTSGTPGYVDPTPFVDSDADGLADQYDKTPTQGSGESVGLIPPDKDGDNKADFLDSDSDNDGYTDCEEGNKNMPTSGCPVSTVDDNGMVSWANTDTDYSDPNGNVDDPDPDGGGDLVDEVTGDHEAAYREFLCGKTEFQLSSYQWRLISVPCDANNVEIGTLFQNNSMGDLRQQLGNVRTGSQ